jgi:hypothetical protein
MSTLSTPPPNYLLYNSLSTKKLAVVVDIPGLPYLVSTQIGRILRYGDPFDYGDPTISYGGLVPIGTAPGERGQKILLNLDTSSLTIAQTLEPEQGRASISTLSMAFIDKDQFMTQAVTPGFIIDEILGKEVRIWLGYDQTSFPEDYYIVWRGRVSQVNPKIGVITLQFVDPNIVKRQNIFYAAETATLGATLATDTTINVDTNGDFHKKILGPDGTYDQSVKCYLKIDDEYIEYQQTGFEATGFGVNQFLNVSRGARGTIAAAHDDNATVDAFLELSGHAVDLALKLQLSGWGGPYLTDQSITALAQTGDPDVPLVSNAIVLPTNIDGVRDLGASDGDYITISGDPTPSNNGTFIIEGFQDSSGETNKLILVNTTFVASPGTPAAIAIRSQYDTLPDTCGLMLLGQEVDVAGHQFYKETYLFDSANSYRFFITEGDISGKTFIESQIMLPLGAYCLTRQGKLSMGLTKPPIADDRTTKLDNSNVIMPQNITLQRGLNNRKYFNEIDWTYDYDDDGNADSVRATIDSDSLNIIGLSSVLPIDAQGARTDLNFLTVVEDRERFLLARYSKAAVLLNMQVFFGAGNLIEAGDIVIVSDNGGLQIPNMATGVRDFGEQLLEVINRSIDLKSGIVSLQLLGGVQSLVDDRYATISPASLLTTGSTTTKLRIIESFGKIYPVQEQLKWIDYVGLRIKVHSPDYTTRFQIVTFTGFDPSDNHAMLISPALTFSPQINDIIELDDYSTSTDPNDQRLAKLVHVYLDPSVAVASGTSSTVFDVGSGDISKFSEGRTILIHSADYTSLSPEANILSVVGTTITVDTDLGFTPSSGQTVELIGFADFDGTNGGPYRFV